MPATRRHPHDHEDGPTLLFERQPPPSRCHICPYRHVLDSMSLETAAVPRRGVLPLPPHHPDATTSPLPLPPLHPVATHARDPLAASPSTHPFTAPPSADTARPSLLPAPRGSGTLILPDALKPGGPEAATVARPLDADDAPPHRASELAFDELASPDITVLQIPVAAPAPARAPRKRPPSDPRVFLVVNLCLGVLIVLGLLVLAARVVQPTPAADAPELHRSPNPEPHRTLVPATPEPHRTLAPATPEPHATR